VTGRVYNPTSQEYVRDAEVVIEGTSLQSATEVGGFFTLSNVPAGEVVLTVRFSGYNSVSQTFQVNAGETATREVELLPARRQPGTGQDDPIELSAFVVSSEREGNAKAIMSQKRNMNVTTSVASDIFGDVTDGNVGEFLKYLPGVDLDYVESETRGPRLGGMDGQYVGVSFDGVKLASADAGRTGNLGRATSFEAFSINSIESIEINLTASSDSDADSPAGTINMRTRRAFDRKGRRIAYNFSLNMNSEEFTLKKTPGPSGREEYKARPNYSLEYSDVFFDSRLGIVAAYSHVDSYTEQYRHNLTFNRYVSAGDVRPTVITQLNFKDGNKNIGKDTYTVTADFKASPHLVLSNTIIYNYALGQFFNRNMTFNASANNTNANANSGRHRSLGDLTEVRTNGLATNTSRNGGISNGDASKRTHTFSLAPRFEYKRGSWLVDGAATYSRSSNNYEAIEAGHVRSTVTNAIVSDWVATRDNIQSHEWTVQQINGADWFDLNNHVNPRITNEGRYARTEIYSGMLNAKWTAPFRIPTSFKFGGKWTEEARKNGNETSYYTWQYIGPGGGPTGSWAAYPNRNTFSTGSTNMITTKNAAGEVRVMPMIDPNGVADLYREHPEWFVNNATADNYYNAYIAPRRDIIQTVNAGYGLLDMRPLQRLQIRAGLRWEETSSDATEYDPLTRTEMIAAGYAVNAAGRATTIPGLEHQHFTRPEIVRSKKYDNLFPMIAAKFDIRENLQFHASANKAISRPPIDQLTGSWLINDETFLVTSPNPNLLPENSRNYVARLAYYFEPAGQFTLTVRQNDIENLRATRRGTAEEFGLGDDPIYSSYEFQAPFNIANAVRFRGVEMGYSQSLSFLPDPFRSTTVNLSYSRTYASERRPNIAPHRVTASIGYRYKRFSTRVGVIWHDDTSWDEIYGRYKRHTTKYDLGGEFRINTRLSLYFQGRNIFNDSQRWFESPAVEGEAGALRIVENYGTNWNFGVKGTF